MRAFALIALSVIGLACRTAARVNEGGPPLCLREVLDTTGLGPRPLLIIDGLVHVRLSGEEVDAALANRVIVSREVIRDPMSLSAGTGVIILKTRARTRRDPSAC